MPDVPVGRQFNGTMRLIEVQLRRAGESYDLEQNLTNTIEKGMINQEQADFIRYSMELGRRAKAGEELDEDELSSVIKRLHKLVSNNLNMGDCA